MSSAAQAFDPVRYKETTKQQWDAAAEAWHRWEPTIAAWLGPATDAMLDMAGVGAGSRVLDVAAGAGAQTMAAARRVGPTGRVLATDIAPDILAFAAAAARAAGLANVETRVMDGEALDDLEPESFDAVISRVGLMFFPDQAKALRGIARVLRPGGRVAAVVFSTPERNRFFSVPIAILRRRASLPPPLPGQPGVFSLGGPGVLEAAYRATGFRDIAIERIPSPLRLRSAAECVQLQKESFGALHHMMEGLSEAERDAAWKEIEAEHLQFQGPTGFVGPCEMLVGSAAK